jgi:hypothetical protein
MAEGGASRRTPQWALQIVPRQRCCEAPAGLPSRSLPVPLFCPKLSFSSLKSVRAGAAMPVAKHAFVLSLACALSSLERAEFYRRY